MKNFFRPVNIEAFKYITIVWVPQVESVELMVQEHYDIPEYADTLFLINTFYDNDGLFLNKFYFPQKRKIYYCLEHFDEIYKDKDTYELIDYFNYLGITEIWSMENMGDCFYPFETKIMPLRYTSLITPSTKIVTKDFDIGFVGVIDYISSPKRSSFFNDYAFKRNIDFSMKILNGDNIMNFKDELQNCKFVLDLNRKYTQKSQNQVRIFEHLCLGHTILSQTNENNNFEGLIYQWDTIDDLNDLIHTLEPKSMIEEYKELTYSDESYNNYKNNILN